MIYLCNYFSENRYKFDDFGIMRKKEQIWLVVYL